MEYPDLPPHQANFCSMCRAELDDNSKTEYRKVGMPPLCQTHLQDLILKREKCLHLFQNLKIF